MKTFEDLRRIEAEKKKLQEEQRKSQDVNINSTASKSTQSSATPNPNKDKELENERRRFEEELEMQILNPSYNPTTSYNPYKDGHKKLYRSILISVVIFGILSLGGWYYTKNHYETLSNNNVDMIERAISSSVQQYYNDNGRYPVDIQGNIDYNLLQKRGYLQLNVEDYRSKFILDNHYRVIRTEWLT